MTEQTNRSAAYQAASPHPDLKSLEKLVGMWTPSFFSALYLEGSKIGEVFPGGS